MDIKVLADVPADGTEGELEKSQVRLKESVKRELHALELSRHLQEAPISETRRLLQEVRDAQTVIQRYEQATGRSKSQLLREAAGAEDRRHVLKDQRQPREPARYRHANQRSAEDDQGGRAPDQGCDRQICTLARNESRRAKTRAGALRKR
jgi:hypothetical protein